MSHRRPLLALLAAHAPADSHESGMLAEMVTFVENHADCFHRSLAVGHITASAWIVDLRRESVLLVHHGKLDKWLQPGGHCDGETDVPAAALREAREETGLASLRLVNGQVFDVDNHSKTAR